MWKLEGMRTQVHARPCHAAHGSINGTLPLQVTWAGVAQLTCLKTLRTLRCAGVRFAPAHAQEPQLPVLVRQLEELTVGTCAQVTQLG